MKRNWHGAVVSGILVLATALAGCGPAARHATTTSSSSGSAKPSGTFSFYINKGTVWDPAIWNWGAHMDQIGIFEGLVRLGKSMAVRPGVAESWTTSSNGLVWTFQLRHNAEFSNGDPVTAQTFVYSMERAVNPATSKAAGAGTSWFNDVPIVNGEQIAAGQADPSTLGVKATGTYTLTITLTKPDTQLLDQLAIDPWQLPVDPKVVQGAAPTIWTNAATIIGNGPYMVQSVTPNVGMTLVPNPHYWGHVTLAKVNLVFTATKQLLAFEGGQLDAAVLASTDIPTVKSSTTLSKELHWVPTAITYTVRVWNSSNNIFQNQLVREAFAMAIDKQTISEKILNGTGTPAYGQIPTWMAPFEQQIGYQYNVQKAQQLLAQAGYPGGKGFPTVSVLDATFGSPDAVAEAVIQMWEQNLGVTVKFDGQNWGTYVKDISAPNPSTVVGYYQNGYGVPLPDWQSSIPHHVVGSGGDPTLPETLSGSDYAQYYAITQNVALSTADKLAQEKAFLLAHANPTEVQMLKTAQQAWATTDSTSAMKLFKQFETEREQMAYVDPIYTVQNAMLIRSTVQGYHPMQLWLSTPPDWINDITIS